MSFNPNRPREEMWRPWHQPARDPREIEAEALEAAVPSPSATPPFTREQVEARIAQRHREIEQTPCYRCGHKPAKPDPDCFCCLAAHTPDGDGIFSMPEVDP